MREVVVEGGPRDRGRAHGEELRDAIQDAFGAWRDGVGAEVEVDVDDFLGRLVHDTDFVAAARRHTPALLEEVDGVAEGSGLGGDECLAYQLMDEEWWFRREAGGATRAGGPEACSTAGAGPAPSQPTVIGQNMDLESLRDGAQVVLRIRPPHDEGPEALVLSAAGLLATTGCNAAGVGVCVNALGELAHRADGVPVAFVIRAVLGRASLDEAAELLGTLPHASPQNYLVGGRDGIRDLECSAAGATELAPRDGRVVHTNHPLVSDDRDPAPPPPGGREGSTTNERFDVLADRILSGAGALTPTMVQQALADTSAPVSVPRSGGRAFMTFGSVVMELGEAVSFHVAPGPPDRTPYSRYDF